MNLQNEKEKNKNTIGKQLEQMAQLFNTLNRDCSSHNTSCHTTLNCQQTCANDGNIYICDSKSLMCTPLDTRNETNQTVKCNPAKGILSVLVNYQQFNQANWECKSIYPQLINSDESLAEGVCLNGNLKNMNINTHLPQPTDCQCQLTDTLLTFKNSLIPHCVKFKTLFSPDDVDIIDND
jgi:hypothetical protein